MNQESHLISSVSSRAKKEVRNKGGIHSHEKIYLKTSGTDASFALRVFVSELFAGRRDIVFVRKEADASLIIGDKTLDDTADELLVSVLCGTAASYLKVPETRTIHPFSGILRNEISAYAKYFGWNKETAESSAAAVSTASPVYSETPLLCGRVHDFLNEFSKDRPSAKYALKNVTDKFHEKADILSQQIDNYGKM